jgi:YegS/Rv2252/BmrU family lipid kinase
MAPRRYFLIVNLIAGQGRCKQVFPLVRAQLDRLGVDYDLHYTNEPHEATDVARMGIDAGFSHIVAMGGDGTVNEVANGLVGAEATLAVIPAGKGNDFVRMLRIPSDPLKAADLLLAGTERVVDLGRVAGRHFVNGLGIGIDAEVAREVLAMERMRGATAYIYAAVKQVFRFRAFPVTLRFGEAVEQMDCISLGVDNGQFAGGGFKLAPRARVDDGLLDVVAVGEYPRLERLVRLPMARAGAHVNWRRVTYRQDASVEVASPSKLVAHLDGEPFTLPRDRFTVDVVPDSLRVLVSE